MVSRTKAATERQKNEKNACGKHYEREQKAITSIGWDSIEIV